jgi:hypothetical protein
MSMTGWILFFVVGVSLLAAKMFVPPAENQSVFLRRVILTLAILFVASLWTFLLIYDHYQNLNVQLKEREIGLYQKVLLRNLSVAQE